MAVPGEKPMTVDIPLVLFVRGSSEATCPAR